MSWTLVREAAKPERRRAGRKLALTILTVTALATVLMGQALLGGVARIQTAIIINPLTSGKPCTAGPTDGTARSRNAATVAVTGAALGVSQAGQVIGIAVTLVEAGGLNLASQAVPESINYPHDGVAPGDHDSVGIFQQRASWGTVQQRMDVQYAATSFFTRLLGVAGWESMDPGAVAQKVQVSAYPDRYAGKMQEAAALLSGGPQLVPCTPAPAAGPNGSGFTDGTATGAGNSPRTAAEAIAWARAEAASGNGGWYRRCLAFVAQSYGWSYSGVNYAIDHYSAVPPQDQHPADGPDGRTPPPGAAMYWDTGSRAGHIALYLGGGQIASNDIVTNGQISVVPANAPETQWHARYVGWTTPGLFPRGG